MFPKVGKESYKKGEARQQPLYGSMISALPLANKATDEPYHNLKIK
jgi:hypothetical protein